MVVMVIRTGGRIYPSSTKATYWADLATERERHLTTGKRAKTTLLYFRCPICRSAIGQAPRLFDLRAPSSTDVPVLLLNQPTNSPDRPPYISLKNLPREFDKRAKHFPFGDHFVYSHNLFS